MLMRASRLFVFGFPLFAALCAGVLGVFVVGGLSIGLPGSRVATDGIGFALAIFIAIRSQKRSLELARDISNIQRTGS